MTKEEILDKVYGREIPPIQPMLKAMDEYAQEIAALFVDWTWENGWIRCFYDGEYKGYYNPDPNSPNHDLTEITAPELYNKFFQYLQTLKP